MSRQNRILENGEEIKEGEQKTMLALIPMWDFGNHDEGRVSFV
jgi:hypothetical protein